MPDVTVKRVEDFEAIFGGGFRRARAGLGVSSFGLAVIDLPPNFSHYPEHDQTHDDQEEVYTVINDSGRVKLDDEVIEIRQWDVIRVAPNVARGFEAGPDGLEIIAAGGSKPEGGDGSLVEDHWSGDK